MAKHWRKKMEEARAAIPNAFMCGALEVSAVDANTINVAVTDPGEDPASVNLDMDDAQRLADWLRRSYGVAGKAR